MFCFHAKAVFIKNDSKKFIVHVFLLFFLAFYSTSSFASDCYVEANGTHLTIQNAVDDLNCDTVYLLQTLYQENITISRTMALIGTSSAIIDGSGLKSVITISHNAKVILQNITIQNGYSDQGGGIKNTGDLTLENVTIQQNISNPNRESYGAGIYSSGRLTLIESTIKNNHLTNDTRNGKGAAIYCEGELFIEQSIISENTANFGGGQSGGIYCDNTSEVKITNSTIIKNTASYRAALYFSSSENVIIQNSVISNNAPGGIAIPNQVVHISPTTMTIQESMIANNAPGGGLSAGTSATVTLEDVTVQGNIHTNTALASMSSGASGGGIRNDGTMLILKSKIIGNQADHVGGGILNNGLLTISKSTIAANSVDHTQVQAHIFSAIGGGIYNSSLGTINIVNSTISHNVSAYRGGGMATQGKAYVINSTISTNDALDSGGGFYQMNNLNLNSYSLVIHGTIYNNNAPKGGGVRLSRNHTGVKPEFEFYNTIIAKNTGGDCLGRVISQGSNLDSDQSCHLKAAKFDFIGKNPKLAPLGNYGGPTKTHIPYPKSPVIDTAHHDLLRNDQRGLPRPVGYKVPQESAPDIGAVELQSQK